MRKKKSFCKDFFAIFMITGIFIAGTGRIHGCEEIKKER